MKSPLYSLEELIKWMQSKSIFHKLYNKWAKSGYDKMLIPSCDRHSDKELNYDYLPYSLERLKICTWIENKQKGHRDRLQGRNTKANRAIMQFTKDNKFIKKYKSAMEAEREIGVNHSNIASCCKGYKNYNTVGGYIWKYEKN